VEVLEMYNIPAVMVVAVVEAIQIQRVLLVQEPLTKVLLAA
jgi:hypothetical protein